MARLTLMEEILLLGLKDREVGHFYIYFLKKPSLFDFNFIEYSGFLYILVFFRVTPRFGMIASVRDCVVVL